MSYLPKNFGQPTQNHSKPATLKGMTHCTDSSVKGSIVARQKHNMPHNLRKTEIQETLHEKSALFSMRRRNWNELQFAAVTKTHYNCCLHSSHWDVWSRVAPVGHILRQKGSVLQWLMFYSSSSWIWGSLYLVWACERMTTTWDSQLAWVDWQVSIEMRLKELPVCTLIGTKPVNDPGKCQDTLQNGFLFDQKRFKRGPERFEPLFHP